MSNYTHLFHNHNHILYISTKSQKKLSQANYIILFLTANKLGLADYNKNRIKIEY